MIALEVTRLARNSPDWHHLIYLCRFSETLIADEHTVYDPEDSCDRMVLGIRGQMSELELEGSIERRVSARWNKAERGELVTIPPAGYDVDELGQLAMTSTRRWRMRSAPRSRSSTSWAALGRYSFGGNAKG